MKRISYILMIIFFISCKQGNESNKINLIDEQMDSLPLKEQLDTTVVKSKITFCIDSLGKINIEWVEYYRKRIHDFSIEKFELKNKWTEKTLLNGNVFGDFDKEFNKNHKMYLINSPDNNQYIDLDSYQINIEKDNAGELIRKGGEIDQEINLVNRKTKEVKRIDFFGSTSRIEDAKWLNNDNVVLYGIMDKKLIIEVIQIKELNYCLYIYPKIMTEKGDYNKEIRLKEVKFE